MIERVVAAARERRHGEAADRARRNHAEQLTQRMNEGREDLAAFAQAVRAEPGAGRVLLARGRDVDGAPYWVGLPAANPIAGHTLIHGATGSGKSFLVLGVLLQVVPRGIPVVLFDMKGELSELLVDVVLPAIASTTATDELLENLRIIRPFDREYLPHLRITEVEPGVAPQAQAYALTDAVEEALGEPLGPRMRRIFLRLSSLAVERSEPLPTVLDWLAQPARFARAVASSSDDSLRAYAFEDFSREDAHSLDALRARLDTFLLLPQTRLMLSSPSCVSLAAAIETGVTIIDCSHPPVGSERLSRFWASLLLGRLTRAILSRDVADDSPHVLVVAEEFQEALGAHQAEQWGRLTSLARFKKTAIWCLHQAAAQVSEVSPALLRLLRTNSTYEMIFRSNYEDAAVLAPLLFTARDGRSTREARDTLIREIVRLPRRSFFLLAKDTGCQAQLVRSPRIDLERLRAQASRVDPQTRRYIRRGQVASPRADLERFMRARRRAEPDTSPFDDLLKTLSPVAQEASRFPGLGR